MTFVQKPSVVIAVGYSVRALVEACSYAGLESVAVDHFGDADTREFADNRWIELKLTAQGLFSSDTQHLLEAAATEFLHADKSIVFVLGGGMENLGGAVEQMREIGLVLGPDEEQRRALRDIEFLFNVAHEVGIQTPQLRLGRFSDSSWLWKPCLGAGGLKIVRGDCAGAGVDRESGYWQEFIRGEPIGVGCLVGQVSCQILGATSGFDAADWTGPSEFIYRGSYGPITLSTACQSQIEGMCHRIRESIGYLGWLQFDFIRDQWGELWLLECNPRWTAGMEVCLFASDVNPVRDLFLSKNLTASITSDGKGSEFECFAKAIVYAAQPVNLTDELIARLNQIEGLADRPYTPQLIERGHPIATVRAGLKGDQASQFEEENRVRLLDELRQLADVVKSSIIP